MFTIDARKLYLPGPFPQEARISIHEEKVVKVGQQEKSSQHLNALQYDLVPGFIDVQINGGFGFDFTNSPVSMWSVGTRLPEFGVTSFLPTIITSPIKTINEAIDAWKNERPQDYHGADIPGLHLEGPFINPKARGAHELEFIQSSDPKLIEEWTAENGIRLVTIAPELPGAKNLIVTLTQRNVVVSAGHSMADLFQARDGFAAGIRSATHLFNAMTPIHHRIPGLVMAILDNDQIMYGMICDGIHVAAEMVRLAWKYNGYDRLILVTDAMAALGMPDGVYQLGGLSVQIQNQTARLNDGTLAGSVLKPAQALKNLMRMTKCSLSDGVTCWTKNPASLLNLSDRGEIRLGRLADFVLMTVDQEIAATFIRGELAYQAPWADLNWESE